LKDDVSSKKVSWFPRIATGLVVVVSNLFAGTALGLLWVKLFVNVDMGLGGVADVLGGMMAGALASLVVSALIVVLLTLRVQWIWIGVAVVVGGLTFAGLAITAPKREEPAPEPIVKQDFQPFFRVNMRINHTEEILDAIPADERPFPFTEAELFSGIPELIRVDWGPDYGRCVATPADADLEALLSHVQEVMTTDTSECRTPEDDLRLSVGWNVAGESDSQGLDAGCLPDEPEIVALADAIGTLADRLCESEVESN
jgi:hypothetical protein